MPGTVEYVASGAAAHLQSTSTGTADVKTISPPTGMPCHGCFITVETNAARITLDGETPDAAHGLIVPKDSMPLFIPVGRAIKFVSVAAANSVVNVLWVG